MGGIPIHAVTSQGKFIEWKGYYEHLYNEHKRNAIQFIEKTIKDEKCIVSLKDYEPSQDKLIFIGDEYSSGKFEVITKLDKVGNLLADLTEVTTVYSNKKENKDSRQGRFLKPWRLLYITKRQASKPSICKIVNQILLQKSTANFRYSTKRV